MCDQSHAVNSSYFSALVYYSQNSSELPTRVTESQFVRQWKSKREAEATFINATGGTTIRYPGVIEIETRRSDHGIVLFDGRSTGRNCARWKEQGVDGSCCRLPRVQTSFVSFMLLMRDRIIAPSYRGLLSSSSCTLAVRSSSSFFRRPLVLCPESHKDDRGASLTPYQRRKASIFLARDKHRHPVVEKTPLYPLVFAEFHGSLRFLYFYIVFGGKIRGLFARC